MAIIQTIDNASQFRDEFHRAGRGNQFSYEGLGLLFEYLSDIGEDVELDVVALCCDFSEDMPEDIANSYSIDIEGLSDGEITDAVMAYLDDNSVTVGITSSGAFVYHQF
jgi:hypothetical protein